MAHPTKTIAILLLAMALSITGCRRPPDTDVSASPYYNFSSFTNTVWKTKGKVALTDTKQYTGRHALTLFPSKIFDPTQPGYNSVDLVNIRLIAELPVGTRVRIGRLMEDNGNWGGVRVKGVLDDGREVVIDDMLLSKNKFLNTTLTSPSTNWGVAPDMLETAGSSPTNR